MLWTQLNLSKGVAIKINIKYIIELWYVARTHIIKEVCKGMKYEKYCFRVTTVRCSTTASQQALKWSLNPRSKNNLLLL